MFAQTNLTVVPVPQTLSPYVSLLTPDMAAYARSFQGLVSGLSPDMLAPIVPYSVILENASSQPLLGTSVVFTVEDAKGKTLRYSFNTIDLDPSSPTLLQPGAHRFVSISNPANHMVIEKRPEYLSRQRITLSQVVAELRADMRVSVSVEAVITMNGLLLGPDSNGDLSRRVLAEQQADAFLLAQLAASPGSEIQVLRTLSALPVAKTGNPFMEDFYTLKLIDSANQLLSLINRGGKTAVSGYIARVQKRVVVTRP